MTKLSVLVALIRSQAAVTEGRKAEFFRYFNWVIYLGAPRAIQSITIPRALQ
jgi:hypothetical protein